MPWRGRALIDCVFDVVRVVLTPPELWVAVGRTGQDPKLFEHLSTHRDLVFVEDAADARGPIAGIKAGLASAAQRGIPWVLICGCDMPAIRLQLLAGMVGVAMMNWLKFCWRNSRVSSWPWFSTSA